MSVKGYKFSALTGGGAGALDAQDGAALTDGDIAVVAVAGANYIYELDADSGEAESSPSIIAPDTNGGAKRWKLQRVPTTNSVPVGSIVAFFGGYWTGGAAFVNVLGNTVAAVNALLNADGWYVCNGAALNLAGSPIFNGAGRYLPSLTDDRFVMGDDTAGAVGGSNTFVHAHYTDFHTLTTDEIPPHTHGIDSGITTDGSTVARSANTLTYTASFTTASTGGGLGHNHGWTGPSDATPENRPKFLTAIYIMKVA